MLNPYEKFLGGREAQEIISETPAKLAAIFRRLGPDGAEKALTPGKWNAREIFSHLADCEITFAFRLRQTLAEENHVIQPFDQEKWALYYGAYDAPSALAVFSSIRRWNVALVKNAKPAEYTKEVTHPERGTMTFRTLVDTMAGHDLNHLLQLQSITDKVAST